jgi:putative transposase
MLLVDARGVPLSIIVSAAHRHDVRLLEAVLDARVRSRPRGAQHLCADAAFRGVPAALAIRRRCYIAHVRSRSEERRYRHRHPARRWVVEVAHSWFNRFRKLLVRYEKLHRSYLALNMLAAAIISFRRISARVNIIYG